MSIRHYVCKSIGYIALMHCGRLRATDGEWALSVFVALAVAVVALAAAEHMGGKSSGIVQ